MSELVRQFAEAVKAEGGIAFLVGGTVRDQIMNIPSKDTDLEVYRIEQDKLEVILSKFGKVNEVGKNFAVYKIGQDIDISLPRRDVKTGTGHRGFSVEIDPFMEIEESLYRRDFTINAILRDPLTGDVVDPYGGIPDIQNKLLRVVSKESFQEDSLRVLRLAQFSSRLQFDIHEYTRKLAQETDLSDLPKERIWMELEKMFLKSKKPSIGVLELQNLAITEKLFPSLKHYQRLLEVIDRAVYFIDDLNAGEKLAVLTSIFTWASDLKVLDEFGLTSVDGYNVRQEVEKIHAYNPIRLLKTDYEYHKLSEKLNMKLMVAIMYAYDSPYAREFNETVGRLNIVDGPVKPFIQGRDLINMGMTPSPDFSSILLDAYERQLKGEFRTYEEAYKYVASTY